MLDYTFNNHRHNYAIWTAARAVQRGFTTTLNIKAAIDKSNLKAFAESSVDVSIGEFEQFHRQCCRQIISNLQDVMTGVPTYGRAAKIVSIYLKTSVVLPGKGECNRSKLIHPPIDSILLTNLNSDLKLTGLRNRLWTKFSEEEYWEVVYLIRDTIGCFDWKLERYWTPGLDG